MRIDTDLSRGPVEAHTLAFQPGLGRGQFVDISRQLNNHGAALVGRDLGLQNLRCDVEIDRKPVSDRLVHRLSGEMKDETPLHLEASLPFPNTSKHGHSKEMVTPPSTPGLGQGERLLLVLLAALLAAGLLWFRGGLHPEAPLERLARRSLDLQVALQNGRPTLVEFYADWCEACRSMAPAMETVEARHRDQLDVVLLNVDNPRWQAELERYEVNGIPQLELFDATGVAVGRAIGARSAEELQALSDSLLSGQPLPQLAGVGQLSALGDDPAPGAATTGTMASPRSHG